MLHRDTETEILLLSLDMLKDANALCFLDKRVLSIVSSYLVGFGFGLVWILRKGLIQLAQL